MSFDIFMKGEQKILFKPSAVLCTNIPEKFWGSPCCPLSRRELGQSNCKSLFLYQALQHVEMWTCVLQTPGFKHPCSPSEKFLVKKAEVGAGILFSQPPSCHIFLINLSHAVAQMGGVPKQHLQHQQFPFHWGLSSGWALEPGTSANGSARYCDQ